MRRMICALLSLAVFSLTACGQGSRERPEEDAPRTAPALKILESSKPRQKAPEAEGPELSGQGAGGKASGQEPSGQESPGQEPSAGGVELEGVLCDTALARKIQAYFPLTVSMTGFGGREYYGGVEFCPQNLEGGRRTFENGHITCCRDHHNMAVFTPGRTTLSSRRM